MTPEREAGPSALALLAWLSPAFPVGSFAYSHGLETATELGQVAEAASLMAWLLDLVEHGSAANDAIVAAAAWRAAAANDASAFAQANDLALALCVSRERRLETGAQGNAFVTTIRSAWPSATFMSWPTTGDVAYPAAFGSACAVAGFDLRACLEAFVLAFVQAMVSAAVRLGAIGQTDGQRVIAALIPSASRLADLASRATLDDIGGCAQRSDLAALRHETLYSRLFRS